MTVIQLKAEMDELVLEGHGRLEIVSLAKPPTILNTNKCNLVPNLKGKVSLWNEETIVLIA